MSDGASPRPASRTLGDLVDEMATATPGVEALVFRDQRFGATGGANTLGLMPAFGASSSLPDTPAKVPSPNPQPPHALGSGDRAVIATGAC